MTGVSGSFTDGFLYRYQTGTLGAGGHDYYFTASDGIDITRLPASGVYSGPTVGFSITLTFTKPDGSPLVDTKVYYGTTKGEENSLLGVTDSLGRITSTDPALAGKTLYFRSADGKYTGSLLVPSAGGTVSVPTAEITEFPLIPLVALAIVLGVIVGGVVVWKKVLAKPKAPEPGLEVKPPGPPADELDGKLLNYIAERKGELSILEASRELGVSADEVKAALERLKRAGKIEAE
jgi:hypothetical protein